MKKTNKKNKKKIKGGNKFTGFFKKVYKKLFSKFNTFSWIAFFIILMASLLILYLLIMSIIIYRNQELIDGNRTLKVLFKPFPYVAVTLTALSMTGGIFLLVKSFKI
jgi:hypothetical protein